MEGSMERGDGWWTHKWNYHGIMQCGEQKSIKRSECKFNVWHMMWNIKSSHSYYISLISVLQNSQIMHEQCQTLNLLLLAARLPFVIFGKCSNCWMWQRQPQTGDNQKPSHSCSSLSTTSNTHLRYNSSLWHLKYSFTAHTSSSTNFSATQVLNKTLGPLCVTYYTTAVMSMLLWPIVCVAVWFAEQFRQYTSVYMWSGGRLNTS